MFKLFSKSNSEVSKLNKRYKNLMYKWNKLSSIDRKAGDLIYAEAEEVLQKIILLEKSN